MSTSPSLGFCVYSPSHSHSFTAVALPLVTGALNFGVQRTTGIETESSILDAEVVI
jgi:hypothetical protein